VPQVIDQAICIRHWDFSETSQTVSLFGREQGILRGLAKGAKRVGGRFSGGIDLLTRGQIVAIVKPGRELATLTDWTLERTWRSLRSELGSNQAAYFMADVVQRMLPVGDPHPRLFDCFCRALDAIEDGSTAAHVVLLFQWTALDDLGYRPRVEDATSVLGGGTDEPIAFFPDDGRVGPATGAGWRVRPSTVEVLVRIAAALDEDDHAAALALVDAAKPEAQQRANRLLAAYLRHIVGAPMETMRALFPELGH
jgi:DNA repair protein RecO